MKLLQPAQLAGLEVRNRLTVAPMSRMQANAGGTATADMAEYYARYARNGAGLIVTEALFVDELSSRAYFNQPGLPTDFHRNSWKPVTEAVHAQGGRIFAQLQHGGRLAEPGLNPLHLAASDGAASGNTWQTGRPNAPARAATASEVRAIIEAFAQAAKRAAEAGFDGVEIHGARGYLIDDFLSASTNHRTDEYGGSLERRLKLPLLVVKRVRESIGSLPLSFNLSLYKMDDMQYLPPGGRDEIVAIVRAFRDAGVDILHVSTRKVLRSETWGEPLALTVQKAVPEVAVIANGGLTTLDDCNEAIELTGATMLSLARPFLANPDWIFKARNKLPLMRYTPGQERFPLLQA